MKISSVLAAGAFILTAACATPTPYQPKDQSGYGFSEQKLENNRFRISFSGNAETSRSSVEDALLYRAAELTVSSGYDYFVIADRGTDAKSRLYADSPRYASPFYFGGRYYRRGYGWAPWYDPFWDTPSSYSQVTRYEASAEIAMYKGRKPGADAKAFDARDVQANLRGKILTPAPRR